TGAPHFNDVASGDWFYSYVETLYNNGVVGGINGGSLDSNGLATYNSAGTLNRAEGSKILVDAFELETSYAGTPPNFPDVTSSAWFYNYVETAYAHGILNGYNNGNFGPGDAITREQVAVIAKNSIDESANGSKRRSDYTAGAASAVVPTSPTTPTTPASEGDLSVALSASSPVAQTFPKGASSTAVAAFDFTAMSDDIVISNLVVKRTGVGTDSDWTLYVYDDSDRLTSGKTVNSTTHQATFTGINVTVAAGTTKTITIKADTSTGSTGGDSFFEISAADMLTTNAQSVIGDFPVKSNKQEINTSVSAGTITIIDTGSMTNPKVGEDNVTIGKFKLTTANEAGLVSEIALLIDGTISATDVQNAKLYQGDTELAIVASVNSKDLLAFVLDTPFEIAKGDSRNFTVKADLNTGRGADTVKVYLDEDTDLVATGGTYGFGMAVTSAGYDGGTCAGGSSDECNHCTVQGGEITISSSGPTASDVAVNGDDVVMMDFNITTLSEVTVKQLSMFLTTNDADNNSGDDGGLLKYISTGATANYTDIKIINKDTGAVVMGPVDSNVLTATAAGTTITDNAVAGTDGDGYYVFTDEFTMAAGESLDLQLILDIANNTGTDFVDDTIYATIDIVDGSYPLLKDINNKTIDVGDNVVPTSDITGKTMTVQSPSLTVTKSSTPVSDTAVKGTSDVSLIGLTMAAGAASDVKISEMVVRLYANDNTDFNAGGVATAAGGAGGLSANDYVSNIELWVGDTKIAGPEGMSLVGAITGTGYYKATFDNMNYTVDGGSTIQVIVKGDLSSNVSSTTYLTADIDPDNDITAEDGDGNSVTAGGTTALNLATSPSPLTTISTGGSLTIAVDADTSKEDIAVAGTSDVEISKFKFTTTDEAFIVKKLSINNRQSAANSIGDYDNNVVSVKLSYTNSSGSIETKTGYLTAGTANFSNMDMFIDKDDDATLTVSATLNTVAAGATSGEYIDLNIAFNAFEAVAQGSGETYKGDKVDEQTAAASDLDFGTIVFVDSGVDHAGSADAVTLASSATLTVPDLGDEELPVGTLVKFGADATAYVEATDILIVLTTAYSGAATDLTMTGYVINNDDGDANGDDIYYALPGTGYLTNANRVHVYESKPTITLSSSSPSGSRTQSASDSAFIFTISADSQEKVQLRAGVELTTSDGFDSAGDNNAALAADTDTGDQVDGSSVFAALDNYLASDSVSMLSAEDLSGYARLNFWIKYTGAAVPNFAYLKTNVTASATADPNTGGVALSAALCNAATGTTAFTTTVWFNCDISISAVAAASDTYFHVEIDDSSGLTFAADELHLDRVIAYNEKLTVDVAGDDINTYAANGDNAAAPVAAYLKEGGSTVATGYFDTLTDGVSETTSASVTFIPTTAVEISKGTSKTFTLQTDTADLVEEEAGEDDPITFSIDLGSSTDGSVTAGDFWWNETNFADLTNGGGGTSYSLSAGDTGVITWFGQVANATLSGNTLQY
ncbi:S-layer homology domain-containing protein, partial [Candidatus Gracilibacteria bacterium]|nr:S-layer homology domain-containing protein [Candidatus Gracilibacteria bacterium]